MKKRGILFAALSIFCLWAFCGVANAAIGIGTAPGGIKLAISGNISIANGGSVTLNIVATNNSGNTINVGLLKALVINPVTGARAFGPFDTTANLPALLGPGQSVSFPAYVLGPIPGNLGNQTLAVVFLVLDTNNNVVGTAGWGLLVQP
ncbi:MAG: hypothetical protein P4L43_17030 [Syntrophobacteraceae bacterium]|nr:hypothetical protein [Syntrophobacteraceae bacterium]